MHRFRSVHVPLLLAVAAVVIAVGGTARASDPSAAADVATDAPVVLDVTPRGLVVDGRAPAPITVRNRGTAPVTVDDARVVSLGEADFAVEAVRRRTLQPGEALTIKVMYRPRSPVCRQSFAAAEIEYHAGADTNPTDTSRRRLQTVALRAGEDLSLLTWLIFAPLLGIPLLFFWPRGRERQLRYVALAITAVPLALAARVVAMFDPLFTRSDGNFGYQFVQHVAWIRAFNVEYHVGVDGLSVGLLALTALIGFIAVLASWSIPVERNLRGYFALLLVLETGLLGVFVALDLFLFYVFWELVLVPMFFLIGLWGGPRKEYAAIKFFIYTLLGSVLILLAIIALYYASSATILVDGTPAAHTLDIPKLVHLNDFAKQPALLGFRFTNLLWVLLFVGFAIKVPVVPLHTWLPDAHVEAPTAVSVILASVMLKMGTYGMLRVGWSILPEATRWAAPAVAVLGAVAIVYGAFCALAQTDLKRLVAYSSISHLGFCLLGMAALTPLGVGGAIFQMLSHGVVSGMLFLLVGVLYDRAKTRGLDEFGGVATVMPRYSAVFALAFLASLGLPGLSGFIGELMALVGSFGRFRVSAAVAVFGLIIGAAYNLWAIRRVHLGPLPERWKAVLTGRDLDWREWASLLPLVILTVGMGLYPAPIIDAAASTVSELLAMMGLPSTGLGGGALIAPVLSNIDSLRPFAPELVLILGILVVLGVGLFLKTGSRKLLLGLTVATLVGAALATVTTSVPADVAPRALFGGLLARDGFADYFKLLFAAAGVLVALASGPSNEALDGAEGDRDAAEYGALLLSVVLGAALMASATDLLTAYLSLEFVSILSYVLAAFSRRSPRSAEAGLKYAIYGGVATGAMLYGFSLLYGLAGSTDLGAVRAALQAAPPLVAGTTLALCLAGLGFKVAVVPFHMWVPDVYEGAPTPIAAFFSIVPKAAGFALVYRFLLGGPAPLVADSGPATAWVAVLGAIAVATMTLGNLAALSQRKVKRLLAYSSIAHAGTMAIALTLGTESGARALLLYAGVYLFMNLAAFVALIALIHRGVGETIDDLAGLGRRAPLPAFCLTIALFSLAGLPPLGGFVAKFALFSAAIERGASGGGGLYFGLAAVGVLNTVVSLYYYARVAKVMYFDRADAGAATVQIAPLHAGLLGAVTLAVVALGVYVPPLSSLVARSTGMWAGR